MKKVFLRVHRAVWTVKITLFIIIGILLTACRSMYIPNAQNTPVFKGKQDVIVSGSFSNYQLAYSPTAYIGIMVNGYYRDVKYPDIGKGSSIEFKGEAKGLEAGAGMFKQFQSTSFGIYGGWGKGYCSIIEIRRQYGYYSKGDTHYTRSFLQPIFSFGNDRITGILATRFSSVDFYEIARISKRVFVEPSISMQLRLGKIYFYNQLQLSFVEPEESDYVYGSKPVVSIGFVVHTKDLFGSKQRQNK